jgi:hypothetical protein
MCLRVNALALVLNVIFRKTWIPKDVVVGVFIAPNHFVAVGQVRAPTGGVNR